MDATFHFRKKIGCAALLRSRSLLKSLHETLLTHPWFTLASEEEAQVVWSDQVISPRFPEQLILYHGLIGKTNSFDSPLAVSAVATHQPLHIPQASTRALKAILEPIQEQVTIQAMQVTAIFPPSAAFLYAIPSLKLFYQTVQMKEEESSQLIGLELEQLFSPETRPLLQLHSLYAPIMQGPFLSVMMQSNLPIDQERLQAAWAKPSLLPPTPSQQGNFVSYSDEKEAPHLSLQAEDCLIGQMRVQGNGLQLCLIPPDPVKSLLACTEKLVMSGCIYW